MLKPLFLLTNTSSLNTKNLSPDIFISVDLETTGFDPIKDEILEVAAVKFQNGIVLDRFDTLVKVDRDIPEMVTHITGIKKEDLANAPYWDEVKPALEIFLRDQTIIGHNVFFDTNFLKLKGVNVSDQMYDTLPLATILLPNMPSYSLETISKILNLAHENKHRALSDAEATFELFELLQQKLQDLDTKTKQTFYQVLKKSTSPYLKLFLQNVDVRQFPQDTPITLSLERPALEAPTSAPQTSADFDPKTVTAEIFQAEAFAPHQEFFDQTLQTLLEQKNLLAEYNVQVQSKISFFLALALYSLQTGKQILLANKSYKNLNLIQQKILPELKELLKKNNLPTIACQVLSEPHQYLCLPRLEAIIAKESLEEFEVLFILKIINWLKHTQNGILYELKLQDKEITMIDEVSCNETLCVNKPEKCFYQRALLESTTAQIVALNHYHLINNTLDEKTISHEKVLVIDEVDELENTVFHLMTQTIASNYWLADFEKLGHKLIEVANSAGISSEVIELFQNDFQQLINKLGIIIGLLGIFIQKKIPPEQLNYYIILTKEDLESSDWQKIIDASENLEEFATTTMAKLHEAIEKYQESFSEYSLVQLLLKESQKKYLELQRTFKKDAQAQLLKWIFRTSEDKLYLKSVPYQFFGELNQKLFENMESVLLFSHNIKINNSFQFIKKQLNLDESFTEYCEKKPPQNIELIIPNNLPEGNNDEYFEKSTDLIKNTILENPGKTIVIYTSKKGITSAYLKIAPELKKEGFLLLGQKITGGKGKILEQFKQNPEKAAFICTQYFWEETEFPENSLNCAIIQRLPFDPPEDPHILACSVNYLDDFADFKLPRAILKFKSMYNRLLEYSGGQGKLLVLDNRLLKKTYGQQFLNSLL